MKRLESENEPIAVVDVDKKMPCKEKGKSTNKGEEEIGLEQIAKVINSRVSVSDVSDFPKTIRCRRSPRRSRPTPIMRLS